VPDGGECALDRVRRADVFPVLGREIIVGQKRVARYAQKLVTADQAAG
jgi:hypothetical protein